MLLGNYGRDHQVGAGDSSGFDGSSQSPSSSSILHHHHHNFVSQTPPGVVALGVGAPVISPGEIPSPKHQQQQQQQQQQQHPLQQPGDQMLAAACQRAAGAAAVAAAAGAAEQQRRLKPHSDQVLKCPRCESMNTKFCYYNNYSLTQPRHFCKNCKRYWTKGGALRNVPIGGGCRKNKRVKQRQSDHHHHHHQSHQAPHGAPPGTAGTAAPPPHSSGSDDAITNGGAAGLTSDAASSSMLHHQEFVGGGGGSGAATTPATAGLFDVPKGSNGTTINLGFDRIDIGPRLFHHHHQHHPHPPPSISLNWAAAAAAHMALGASPQSGYDPGPGLLGLNLSGSIKQEPLHGGDINSMFVDHPGLGMSADGGLSAYAQMDGFSGAATAAAAGDVLWRFQQPPKLVSLLEEGADPDNRPLLDLETATTIGGEGRLKQHKGKSSRESMQVSSDYEQGDTSSSPEWQPTSDGFFDSGGGGGGGGSGGGGGGGGGGDTGYWSNGAWTSAGELHSYGSHGQAATGNHQML